MRKLLGILVLMLLATSARAMERAGGYCGQGGYTVTVGGLPPTTTDWFRSFPACTVSVYYTGTTTLATPLYASNSLTNTKSNPFVADVNTGYWYFYAPGGRYDVRFSGGGIPSAYTIGDVEICDPFGPNADSYCVGVGGTSLFASFQFGSNAAMMGVGNYFQLVPDATLTSTYTGSGTLASPYVGTFGLPSTGVAAGSYTNANLTVDGYGRITTASSGTSAGGVVSLDSLTGALTLGIGTTGTAPNWSPSGTTDTLNLPAASGTGVTAGTISHADWLTATSQNALSINSGAMPVNADLIGTNSSGQPVSRTYTNVVALFGGGSCAGVLNYDGTCVTAYITSLPPQLFSVTAGVATLVTQPAGTFFGSPPNGAAAVVQASNVYYNVSGTGITAPLTSYQVQAGHSIIVKIVGPDSSHVTVVDDHPDNFSEIFFDNSHCPAGCAYWLATGVAGGFTTISIGGDAFALSHLASAVALETTPIATSSPVDASASASGSPGSITVGLTTSTANDLIISDGQITYSLNGSTASWLTASPLNMQSQGYGNWTGGSSVSEALATVSAPIVGTYTAKFTYTGVTWNGYGGSIIALKPGASNGVPGFMQLPTHDLQNLTDVNNIRPAGSPSTQVPVGTGAISYQGSAAQGTSGSPLTLMTKGPADAQVTYHVSVNCTAASVSSLAVFLTATDSSNTATTYQPSVQPDCTVLGPASRAMMTLEINTKAGSTATFYSVVTGTPAYDLRITAQQNTTQ